MPRRTKKEAEQTRNALLDAAEKVFYSRGVARTTLAQIAQAAGLTRGAIYWHFKDKVQLCEAMMERTFLPQEEILERLAASASETPLQDIRDSVINCLLEIEGDKRRQRVISILFHRCEYVEDMGVFMKRRNKAKDRMLERSTRMFERAHAKQKLPAPWTPHLAAVTLQAMVSGFISYAMEGRKDFKLSTHGVQSMKAFFTALGHKL
jgi:AcrR family transcriptional regulator